MENELNMAKFMNKRSSEDVEKISQLESQLEAQRVDKEREVTELREKLAHFEKQINNISSMEMQIESLQSEVKYKTEQANRLQHEAFSKDIDFENLRKEIDTLK